MKKRPFSLPVALSAIAPAFVVFSLVACTSDGISKLNKDERVLFDTMIKHIYEFKAPNAIRVLDVGIRGSDENLEYYVQITELIPTGNYSDYYFRCSLTSEGGFDTMAYRTNYEDAPAISVKKVNNALQSYWEKEAGL